MNTVNYNNLGAITDPTYVGVDDNRLVVTTKVRNFGTFGATITGDYTPLPWFKASSFRISNLTGKTIGVRPRHISSIVDNFEDNLFPEWTGTIESSKRLDEGLVGAKITGTAYRALGNDVMLDGTEVDFVVELPAGDYSVKFCIYDDYSRVGMTGAGEVVLTPSNSISNTKLKVTIRMNPNAGTYSAYLENLAQGTRTTLITDEAGVFGTNNMIGSIIYIDTGDDEIFVDPIVLHQKANQSIEHIGHGGNFVYPCMENTAEYEVINLGSEAGNYADNTNPVSISGFYAV